MEGASLFVCLFVFIIHNSVTSLSKTPTFSLVLRTRGRRLFRLLTLVFELFINESNFFFLSLRCIYCLYRWALFFKGLKQRKWMNKSQSVIKDNTFMIFCSFCSLARALIYYFIMFIIYLLQRFIIVEISSLMLFLVRDHSGGNFLCLHQYPVAKLHSFFFLRPANVFIFVVYYL